MLIKCRYTIGIFLFLFSATLLAQIEIPTLSQRVTDLTNTLFPEELAALEKKLADFETRKGSQIAVLILPTTEPEDIAAFGIRVADSWKIGRKNIDDGIILIVAKEDRKLRIEVGRGLEGVIPDAIAKRIISEIITPFFKDYHIQGGINAGVDQLIKLIDGEKLPAPNINQVMESIDSNHLTAIIFGLMMLDVFAKVWAGWIRGMFITGIAVVIIGVLVHPESYTEMGSSPLFFISAFFIGIVGSVILKLIMIFNSSKTLNSNFDMSDFSSSDSSSSSSSFSGSGGSFSGGGASGSW